MFWYKILHFYQKWPYFNLTENRNSSYEVNSAATFKNWLFSVYSLSSLCWRRRRCYIFSFLMPLFLDEAWQIRPKYFNTKFFIFFPKLTSDWVERFSINGELSILVSVSTHCLVDAVRCYMFSFLMPLFLDEAWQSSPRRAHWLKVIELLSSCDENSISLHSRGNTKCFNILQTTCLFSSPLAYPEHCTVHCVEKQ